MFRPGRGLGYTLASRRRPARPVYTGIRSLCRHVPASHRPVPQAVPPANARPRNAPEARPARGARRVRPPRAAPTGLVTRVRTGLRNREESVRTRGVRSARRNREGNARAKGVRTGPRNRVASGRCVASVLRMYVRRVRRALGRSGRKAVRRVRLRLGPRRRARRVRGRRRRKAGAVRVRTSRSAGRVFARSTIFGAMRSSATTRWIRWRTRSIGPSVEKTRSLRRRCMEYSVRLP